jgi:hypothetical protein
VLSKKAEARGLREVEAAAVRACLLCISPLHHFSFHDVMIHKSNPFSTTSPALLPAPAPLLLRRCFISDSALHFGMTAPFVPSSDGDIILLAKYKKELLA